MTKKVATNSNKECEVIKSVATWHCCVNERQCIIIIFNILDPRTCTVLTLLLYFPRDKYQTLQTGRPYNSLSFGISPSVCKDTKKFVDFPEQLFLSVNYCTTSFSNNNFEFLGRSSSSGRGGELGLSYQGLWHRATIRLRTISKLGLMSQHRVINLKSLQQVWNILEFPCS